MIPSVLAILLLALPMPGWIAATALSPRREFDEHPADTREYAFVRRHLRSPFAAYGRLDVFVPQFGVIALSHMASGLMNVYVAQPERRDELLALATEIARRARSAAIAPQRRDIRADDAIDTHHLYWSHLALVLGVERQIRCGGGPCADTDDDRLLERIARTLHARLRASPTAQLASYPSSPTWPADNAVTLVALRLYDASHDTQLADAPTRAFVAAMSLHRDRATGLYHSSISPVRYHATPRGCALSWTALYLAQVAPEAALAQYVAQREHLARDVLGLGGFREWPAGRGGGMDGDSGPIVFGVGMAATGLGLGAARMFRDEDRYATIRRTSLVVGGPSWIPSHGYLFAPLLGEAMLFNGRTARPWFGPVGAVHSRASLPWLPLALTALDATALALLARRLSRALRWRLAARRVTLAADGSAPSASC